METESLPPETDSNWRTNLLITLGVVGTVLAALLLAQLDSLQIRPQPSPLPIIVAERTQQPTATNTPLPAIPLASSTNTPIPPTATPTSAATPAATAVAVLPTCGRIPPGWVPTLVRPGDTLFKLSLRSGATIDEIMQANCLQMTRLISGSTLYLPPTPPVRPPCGPPSHWVQTVIQRGDTVFSLAQARGTTVYAVLHANCLSSSAIKAGQVLYLPPLPSTPTATATSTPIPSATATSLPTATATGTAVPTQTHTPTITATQSPTASVTATPAATGSATATPTATATGSPTASATPSATPTASNTPTTSATPTSSNTPTATATATATPSATPTPTATETATPTATATP